MSHAKPGYYLPDPSGWPLVGSIGLFCLLVGAANWLHHNWFGPYLFATGFLIIVYMLFGWFGRVINENLAGLYDEQVDRSYRWAMAWFIFSEVCFFGVFFGALFYTRLMTVPWLAGQYMDYPLTNLLLYPNFKDTWPMLVNPVPSQFSGPSSVMGAWGIPAINTLILLTSGVTITWAHWALKLEKHKQLVIGLALTIALGLTFLFLQVIEYHEAYALKGLTLNSGMYGTTFFMLTGFHGLHVTLGTIMLIVIWIRSIKKHFTPHNHFAFEAVAWYWHFVDVVWLFLFVFVYWL